MNTANNKRRKASREKIEAEFMRLLEEKTLTQISVSELCLRAGINRSTFYANYTDIYDLADKLREKLEQNTQMLCPKEISAGAGNCDYLYLFKHIRENIIYYKTYFRLGYTLDYKISAYDAALAEKHFQNKHINYHCEFFRAGITKIIEMWLEGGCVETPEEMEEILKSEYSGRV